MISSRGRVIILNLDFRNVNAGYLEDRLIDFFKWNRQAHKGHSIAEQQEREDSEREM